MPSEECDWCQEEDHDQQIRDRVFHRADCPGGIADRLWCVYVNRASDTHVKRLMAAQYSQVKVALASKREVAPATYFSTMNLEAPGNGCVHSKMDGTIVRMFVQPGDTVREGQVLAELVNDEPLSQILQADGKVAEARAGLIQNEQIAASLPGTGDLNAISQQQYDEAVARRDSADAQVMSSQAYRDQLATRLTSRMIVAPLSGDVLKVYHAAGSFIRTGDTLIMVGDFKSAGQDCSEPG